ncbi:hypothetical protein PMAYCL1PPCAC_04266, partial [Pristionchus mayeri]
KMPAVHLDLTGPGSLSVDQWARFSSPSLRSNVIVKIGEKKLYVSKEFLAIHSPFFETLFFGNFAEKGKEEVEIKDVVYEEFLVLLHLIYPSDFQLTDHFVIPILALGDRFQMQHLHQLASSHIQHSKTISPSVKLMLA